MNKYTIIGSILISLGVPPIVLRYTENYGLNFAPAYYNKNGENKQVAINKQQAFFANAGGILHKNPMRILIYSNDNVQCARAVALRLFINFIHDKYAPKWYLPTDDYKFKHDEMLQILQSGILQSLIVLDNLNIYMNVVKQEKVSRIVSQAGCPIIVILSGKQPFNYCQEKLGFTPDFILRAELNKVSTHEIKRGLTSAKRERL